MSLVVTCTALSQCNSRNCMGDLEPTRRLAPPGSLHLLGSWALSQPRKGALFVQPRSRWRRETVQSRYGVISSPRHGLLHFLSMPQQLQQPACHPRRLASAPRHPRAPPAAPPGPLLLPPGAGCAGPPAGQPCGPRWQQSPWLRRHSPGPQCSTACTLKAAGQRSGWWAVRLLCTYCLPEHEAAASAEMPLEGCIPSLVTHPSASLKGAKSCGRRVG